jgi:hypothetical protein
VEIITSVAGYFKEGNRWNKTGGTKQVEQNRWNKTGGTKQVEQNRWNKTGGTKQVEMLNKTGGTKQVEMLNKTQVEQNRWNKTGGTHASTTRRTLSVSWSAVVRVPKWADEDKPERKNGGERRGEKGRGEREKVSNSNSVQYSNCPLSFVASPTTTSITHHNHPPQSPTTITHHTTHHTTTPTTHSPNELFEAAARQLFGGRKVFRTPSSRSRLLMVRPLAK